MWSGKRFKNLLMDRGKYFTSLHYGKLVEITKNDQGTSK